MSRSARRPAPKTPAPAASAPRLQHATPSQLLQCFAIVAPGLESLALAEAQRLGLPARLDEGTGAGGIAWEGDIRSVLLANAGLRIASRVVVRLATFEARSFAELERHARHIPWSRVVLPGGAVRFRVTCKKSKLYHSGAVAQRFADAVARAVPGVRAEGASGADDDPEHAEDAQLFVVRLLRDHCMVSADSSGALLHRRGYRLATAKAPLRETIAAALIMASGWDAAVPLVDPLCGSGTIPIEAALLAHGRAPGTARRFAAERWPGVSKSMGGRIREELAARERTGPLPPIIASDRDVGAISSAVANAERAGVSGDVAFAAQTLSEATFPAATRGWVVTNPPYGIRVGDAERVRDLWAHLGNVLRARARGWRVALMSPDPALERQLRIPVKVVAQASNGGIPVRLVVGDVA